MSEKRRQQDLRLTIGLFVVLFVLLSAAAALELLREEQVPLSTTSNAPDGARAFLLWLEDLPHAVTAEPQVRFAIPDATEIVVVLEPSASFGGLEIQTLNDWVEGGGTAIIVGRNFNTLSLLSQLEFTVEPHDPVTGQLVAAVLHSPDLSSAPDVTWAASVLPEDESELRTNWTTLLETEAGPALGLLTRGDGHFIVGTSAIPFTNSGLQTPANAALVSNLLTLVNEPDAQIWVDEWHHGQRLFETRGVANWLRYTPTGRSLAYLMLLAFAVIVIQGRRLGRPVPPAAELRRRSPVEYVNAMASLNRRAGHQRPVQEVYYRQLKRAYSRRYRLDARLDDAAFLEELQQIDPDVDVERLRATFHALQRLKLSESELIEVANSTVDQLQEVNATLSRLTAD